ncbi:MAG: hypothetical protein ACI4S1_01105 [Roseburia sp.]
MTKYGKIVLWLIIVTGIVTFYLQYNYVDEMAVNKYKHKIKILFLVCLINIMFLSACGVKNENKQAESLSCDVTPKIEEENTESNNRIFRYDIPLEEIAKRIEAEYLYENMINHISEWQQKELGFLPVGKEIKLAVYIAEGNKLLFLPEEKANTTVRVNDELCSVYYSEKAKGYIFYVLVDWQLSENGVPVNSFEGDAYHRIRDCIVQEKDTDCEEVEEVDSQEYYYYRFDLEDIVKFGEIKVTFDPEATQDLPEISVDENEYIDEALKFVEEVYGEHQRYGNYRIYLETYGRVQGNYGAYTDCKISAAVVGNDLEDYFFCSIGDNGAISDAYFWYFPMRESPPFLIDQTYLDTESENFIPEIVGLQREVIDLEVTEDVEEEEEKNQGSAGLPEYNQEIDFRTMSEESAAEWIEYIYSYGEWFGMNELGYQAGELSGLCDEEIIMYTWKNNGESLLIVRKSKVNTWITGEEGQAYPVYVNRDGEMEFYQLQRNIYAGEKGQLNTSMFMKYYSLPKYADTMLKLGETRLTTHELQQSEVTEVEEDEYIKAFEKYIENLLSLNSREGKYEIYIGEYEALHTNKVCLSAAVSGDEEYYFRYMIVKSQKGNYYFWPVGFGINGSLEECEMNMHYMNAVCIERTKQLRRSKIVIEVG